MTSRSALRASSVSSSGRAPRTAGTIRRSGSRSGAAAATTARSSSSIRSRLLRAEAGSPAASADRGVGRRARPADRQPSAMGVRLAGCERERAARGVRPVDPDDHAHRRPILRGPRRRDRPGRGRGRGQGIPGTTQANAFAVCLRDEVAGHPKRCRSGSCVPGAHDSPFGCQGTTIGQHLQDPPRERNGRGTKDPSGPRGA